MKALVYWCRWHEAKLRLHGRDDTAVWGELVFAAETQPFHFNLKSRELTIGSEPETRRVRLDEMGVEQSG
jgi:hypothetical protein